MNLVVTVDLTNPKVAAGMLQNALTFVTGMNKTATAPKAQTESTDETEKAPTKKAGKKPVEESETSDDSDIEVDESAMDDESEEEIEEDDAPGVSLDSVKKKFKSFTTDNGRDAAIAVLKKFGVKSILDLKTTKYADIMKALSKKAA